MTRAEFAVAVVATLAGFSTGWLFYVYWLPR